MAELIASVSITLNIILFIVAWLQRSDAAHDAEMAEWDRQLLVKAWQDLEEEMAEHRKLSRQVGKFQPVNIIERIKPR